MLLESHIINLTLLLLLFRLKLEEMYSYKNINKVFLDAFFTNFALAVRVQLLMDVISLFTRLLNLKI